MGINPPSINAGMQLSRPLYVKGALLGTFLLDQYIPFYRPFVDDVLSRASSI